MLKRKAPEPLRSQRPSKAPRADLDRLSALTDELVLRVLGHVSVHTLTICQQVSRRLQSIAGDSQLWKAAYYDRFVRPRASRLPGTRAQPLTPLHLTYSSKVSKWLDEGHLVRKGQTTDWKRQYRLRHNWSRGSCGISEISVAEQLPAPPLLARLHDRVVFTADGAHGLRAFSYKQEQTLLASKPVGQGPGASQPTAFAVDSQDDSQAVHRLALGFDDGAFTIYYYHKLEAHFQHVYSHAASSIGRLTAMAFAWPYLLTMSHTQRLSLYRFLVEPENMVDGNTAAAPLLLASLKSHTIWPPFSLAVRLAAGNILASVAYSIPIFAQGWSAGVQELTISPDGVVQASRIGTAISQGFHPLSGRVGSHEDDDEANEAASSTHYSRPTSLSYSHPYLLCCHTDNTLTLYLVHSSQKGLTMSPGKRLWGHTSSVFGAHVGGRGRAVSVTTRGEEVRVWELEGNTLISTSKAREVRDADTSVKATPEKAAPGSRQLETVSPSTTKGWVGFDEENVIVLRERDAGQQTLAVYDFT